jgi:hypothetical protein
LYAWTHASPNSRSVVASVKVWPQNRGKVGKQSDAGFRVVAAGPHPVVGDRAHGHVVPVEAGRGHVALVDVDQVLEEPDICLGAVGVEAHLIVAATRVDHGADPLALDPRPALDELLW